MVGEDVQPLVCTMQSSSIKSFKAGERGEELNIVLMCKRKGKEKKNTHKCLNNINIRFPTYENECYGRRTRILRPRIRPTGEHTQ